MTKMKKIKLLLLIVLFTSNMQIVSATDNLSIFTDECILVPTILCGGEGSRLWPESRENDPKFFVRLTDGESFLQKAFVRGSTLDNVTNVLTVTNSNYVFRVEDEYKEIDQEDNVIKHFILEPKGRNTAAAIAAASIYAIENISPNAVLLVLAADHLISNQDSFSNAVNQAIKLAQNNFIVTFGITPTSPETGYGYIEADRTNVVRFVEKPNKELAESYIKDGNFIWNSGMFCFRAESMLSEMRSHCPDILNATKFSMTTARKEHNHIYLKKEDFDQVRSESIDYSVMEKTKKAKVIACDIGWSDIGCWKSLGDLTEPDHDNNRIVGEALLTECMNSTVWARHHVIGVVGLDNVVVIDTPDAILVVNKNSAQDVKKITKKLKERGHKAAKTHAKAYKPWGSYEILGEGMGFKTKRINVKPGGHLSLQSHEHRSEHWTVISGTAKVLNGNDELTLMKDDTTFIPACNKHRLENIGNDVLTLIEIQTGSNFDEDDIIRYEDIYGRI